MWTRNPHLEGSEMEASCYLRLIVCTAIHEILISHFTIYQWWDDAFKSDVLWRLLSSASVAAHCMTLKPL